jgi:hypothetical protein
MQYGENEYVELGSIFDEDISEKWLEIANSNASAKRFLDRKHFLEGKINGGSF